MIIGILSKTLSESLLSLYPIFVKKINIPFGLQLWSRFFIYVIVSFLFIDWKFVFETILSTNGLLLSFVTILHVFFSYRGFQLLDSGIAYVCFYTYPIIILLLSGEKIHYITVLYLFVVIFGIYLLFFSSSKEEEKEEYPIIGFIMIFIAAFTEAVIYFIVRSIPTKNSWNHLFLSYFFGAIGFSLYYLFIIGINNVNLTTNIALLIALFINFILGLFGYFLRFYSITRLPTKIYAGLSYIGIIMAFIYGVLWNNEQITFLKIIGAGCIVIPVFLLSI